MVKRLVIFMMCSLSIPAFSQAKLNIAGQEGDERFFPVLQEVYKGIGYDVEFELLPSSRAVLSVNSGLYDAEVGRIRDISNDYQQNNFKPSGNEI